MTTSAPELAAAPQASRKPLILAILGVLAIAGWAFLPQTSLIVGTQSTNGQIHLNGAQAHALCNSALGTIGQSFSPRAAHVCGEVNTAYMFFMILGIAGLVLLACAAVTGFKSIQVRNAS